MAHYECIDITGNARNTELISISTDESFRIKHSQTYGNGGECATDLVSFNLQSIYRVMDFLTTFQHHVTTNDMASTS